jgi:hypothetical protein
LNKNGQRAATIMTKTHCALAILNRKTYEQTLARAERRRIETNIAFL